MKLLMTKLLKCTECKSEGYLKVNASEIKVLDEKIDESRRKIVLDILREDLEDVNDFNLFLENFKEFTEVDGYEFLEGDHRAEDLLVDLFYNRDIIKGSLCCLECNKEKEINEGILYILEEK